MQSQIAKLIARADLTADETRAAFETIMEGQAGEAQIGAFLALLAAKGETVEEIAVAAGVMRAKATAIAAPPGRAVLDTCGTGGDRSGTFNISTAAALIAAAAGATVAKHGNRSVTGVGAAEVLAELGVNIEAPVPVVERCLAEANIGFCFAPLLHSAMKHAIGARRQLGVRTIFNILGPLTNPASARRQLLGVFGRSLTGRLAAVLGALGSERAMVVHGADGLDEITLTGPTFVGEWRDGRVREYELTAGDFGLKPIRLEDIRVGTAAESAEVIRGVLAGRGGPARDIAAANAAAACCVAGLADDLAGGLALCCEAIDSGRAAGALRKLVEVSAGRP